MKLKTILFSMAFMIPVVGFSYWDTVGVYSSSYTATNEGPRVITATPPGTIFVGIVSGTATTNGTIKVYDSSGTASNQIAVVSLGAPGAYYYNIFLSSGLTYTTANNTNGVTILYKKVR